MGFLFYAPFECRDVACYALARLYELRDRTGIRDNDRHGIETQPAAGLSKINFCDERIAREQCRVFCGTVENSPVVTRTPGERCSEIESGFQPDG